MTPETEIQWKNQILINSRLNTAPKEVFAPIIPGVE